MGEKIRVMSGRKLHPLIQQIKSHDFGFHVAYDPLSADVIQLVSRLVKANRTSQRLDPKVKEQSIGSRSQDFGTSKQ